MLKLYNETEIFVNLEESKIIISRGYWNFIQISIGFSNIQKEESDKLINIFNKFSLESQVDETQFEDKYKKILNQLVEEKLIYKSDEKFESKNILMLSDIPEIKEKFIKYKNNIILHSINEFNDKFLNNIIYEEILQNPLLKKEIQENVEKFIINNNIDIIFVMSLKVNDTFFKILNHIFTKKIVYMFFDKDFIYLCGIEKKYTGCYSCFSKNMDARLEKQHKNEKLYILKNKEIYPEKRYLLDLVLSIVEYNLTEYLYKDILPIFGRVCIIFTLTLEIRYENVLRSCFCHECGYLSLMENRERNLNLKNFLNEKRLV
jgi:hypothetical protein